MATQIEVPRTDTPIEPIGDPLEAESERIFSEQNQGDMTARLEADQPVREWHFLKPRSLGRLLLKPFVNRSAESPVQPDIEEHEGERLEPIDETRYQEIIESPLLLELPEAERAEAIAQTFELYKTAKEVVAPVIVGFADYLLEEAGDRQIIFAARDGLGAYLAATKLKEKFNYPNSDPDQLVYAYLSRKVVFGSSHDTLMRYLSELGVHDTEDSVVLADSGMYGTMVPAIRKVLPKVDTHYIISRSTNIPGYADSPSSRMKSTWSADETETHFLEDTFSGTIPSPGSLVEQDNRLVPNTLHSTFPPAETLKRTFAIKAIEDYVSGLDTKPKQPPIEAVKNLDNFLSDRSNFRHLMVPHNR